MAHSSNTPEGTLCRAQVFRGRRDVVGHCDRTAARASASCTEGNQAVEAGAGARAVVIDKGCRLRRDFGSALLAVSLGGPTLALVGRQVHLVVVDWELVGERNTFE